MQSLLLILPLILDEVVDEDFFNDVDDTRPYAYKHSAIRQEFKNKIQVGEDIVDNYKGTESRIDMTGISLAGILVSLQKEIDQKLSKGRNEHDMSDDQENISTSTNIALFSDTYTEDIHRYLDMYTHEKLKELPPQEIKGKMGIFLNNICNMLANAISR